MSSKKNKKTKKQKHLVCGPWKIVFTFTPMWLFIGLKESLDRMKSIESNTFPPFGSLRIARNAVHGKSW